MEYKKLNTKKNLKYLFSLVNRFVIIYLYIDNNTYLLDMCFTDQLRTCSYRNCHC